MNGCRCPEGICLLHPGKKTCSLREMSSNELVERVSDLQGDAFDYAQAEARILGILGPEYIALIRGIAQKSNPLLSDKVRRAVANVFKTQAITGPFPIVDALLSAIWEALKEQ